MSQLQVRLDNPAPIPLAAEFSCAPGELVALVGPSGSGKTSILRAIAGLLHSPSLSGRVQVGSSVWMDSASGTHWSPQTRRAGLVFQNYTLFPHLSAIKNVALGAGSVCAEGVTGAYATALFERMGLAGLEQRLPAELSGGQQQRVALARALVRLHSPQALPADNGVLLLDEPFSAVDAPTRQTLYRELAALRQHVSTPMVLVTHDLHEARRLADRLVILDAGATLQSGTPSAVFSRPRNARVAQLVGIQNLFHGTFHRGEGGFGSLHWAGDGAQTTPVRLKVVDKGRIVDGAQVRWVLAGESMEIFAAGQSLETDVEPMDGNLLWCVLEKVLELGETSLCTLEPKEAKGERLEITLTTSHLRAMGAVLGSTLGLRIAPQAIHIMPVRA